MNRQELLELSQSYENLGIAYHALKTECIPSRKRISDIDFNQWEDFLAYAKKSYEYRPEDHFQHDHLGPDEEQSKRVFLHLKSNITLYNPFTDMAELLYDTTSEEKALEDLQTRFESLMPRKTVHSIGLIQDGGGFLKVKFFDYTLPKHSLIDYLDASTRSFHKNIIRRLNTLQQSGLYLLYGQPGTGKTSFIKEVLSKTSRKALFISPSFTEDLTSPKLISLLMDFPNSILVIEDAESVIMERKADNSSAVSNLLNLTDGFLADFLNLNIICTFNTNLKHIDAALLRDGRLKGMHKFEKMEPENAREIAAVMGREVHPKKPLTLAEICNSPVNSRDCHSRQIGFIS